MNKKNKIKLKYREDLFTKKKKLINNQKGFTLLEFTVLITIISIFMLLFSTIVNQISAGQQGQEIYKNILYIGEYILSHKKCKTASELKNMGNAQLRTSIILIETELSTILDIKCSRSYFEIILDFNAIDNSKNILHFFSSIPNTRVNFNDKKVSVWMTMNINDHLFEKENYYVQTPEEK